MATVGVKGLNLPIAMKQAIGLYNYSSSLDVINFWRNPALKTDIQNNT